MSPIPEDEDPVLTLRRRLSDASQSTHEYANHGGRWINCVEEDCKLDREAIKRADPEGRLV